MPAKKGKKRIVKRKPRTRQRRELNRALDNLRNARREINDAMDHIRDAKRDLD